MQPYVFRLGRLSGAGHGASGALREKGRGPVRHLSLDGDTRGREEEKKIEIIPWVVSVAGLEKKVRNLQCWSRGKKGPSSVIRQGRESDLTWGGSYRLRLIRGGAERKVRNSSSEGEEEGGGVKGKEDRVKSERERRRKRGGKNFEGIFL